MDSDYIVVLNNGTHYTDEPNARKIVEGVDKGERLVDIDLDFHGDGNSVLNVTLALATFVMLYKAPSLRRSDEADGFANSKVTRIR